MPNPRYRLPVLLLLVLLLVAGLSYHARNRPERKARRQIERLADHLSKPPGESDLKRIARLSRLAGLFDKQCEVGFDNRGAWQSFTPQEIVGLVEEHCRPLSVVAVRLTDIQMQAMAEDRIDARFTASAVGKFAGGEAVQEVHRVQCSLRPVQGKWLIHSAILNDNPTRD